MAVPMTPPSMPLETCLGDGSSAKDQVLVYVGTDRHGSKHVTVWSAD